MDKTTGKQSNKNTVKPQQEVVAHQTTGTFSNIKVTKFEKV